MARGAVYYHSQFKFHDGQVGEKRFVVLNNPKNDEPFLVVKTTSDLRDRQYIHGCNPDKGEFFLPANIEPIFNWDTVIQLLDVYEFTQKEMLSSALTERTLTSLGQLSVLCGTSDCQLHQKT